MLSSLKQGRMKRSNSVSPQGWSSEEDQPLDFSRNNNTSAESSPKKSDPPSPIEMTKTTLFNDIKPLIQSPALSEKEDVLRPGFVPIPPALRFPANGSLISPLTPAFSPELLTSNLNALYNFAYTTPEALQASTGLLDPRYLHFRQQQALINTMQQTVTAQRRRTMTQTSTSPSPNPKSNDRSSDISDTNDDLDDTKSKSSKESGGGRRRGRAFPDELKDEAYWERRRKNNEAAKRSRDARRAKEDEIAIRASFLERENFQLRTELNNLKDHLQSLGCTHLYTA